MAKLYFTKPNSKQPNGTGKPDHRQLTESGRSKNKQGHSPSSNSLERTDIPTLNDIADSALNKDQQPSEVAQQAKPTTDIPTLTTPTAKSTQQSRAKSHQTKQPASRAPAQNNINENNPFIPDSVKTAHVQHKLTTNHKKASQPTTSTANHSVSQSQFQSEQSASSLRRIKSLDDGVRNKLRQELEMQSEIVLQELIDEFIPQIEAEFHKRMRAEISDIIDQIISRS
ncbi:hypothetical protein [Spartinivicinus poritis]|uniref:Uncharacterized protein n=1 Tax=Spartinivicinus poritis TaxID=2994640 RepID=A0ABT5U338_9GAMM|nr:hypothetical protein [Spartinivicinus sp. A2-2]MDE1460635.1 hypothetical protein [Spartinivicinus sp. A2-2]